MTALNGKPVPFSTRQLCRDQLARLSDAGFDLMAGLEVEEAAPFAPPFDKVVGGAVPRQFIPSVEKGLRAQMEKGVAAGYQLVDIRVTLVDGKAHSVDSSDMAFQMAGSLGLREAAEATTVTMLEPYDTVTVVVPDDMIGGVMSDLSARRGRLLGTDKSGDDRTVVRAEVPQTELVRYAIDLRSSTHGAGTFTRTFAHYEPMPEDVARNVPPREIR